MAQGVPGSLRPQIFLTFLHYKGDRSSAKCTSYLYPRRNPWYSLSEAELTSGDMVLSRVPWKKSPVTPPGIDPGTVRLVAQCLNHYTTPLLKDITDINLIFSWFHRVLTFRRNIANCHLFFPCTTRSIYVCYMMSLCCVYIYHLSLVYRDIHLIKQV